LPAPAVAPWSCRPFDLSAECRYDEFQLRSGEGKRARLDRLPTACTGTSSSQPGATGFSKSARGLFILSSGPRALALPAARDGEYAIARVRVTGGRGPALQPQPRVADQPDDRRFPLFPSLWLTLCCKGSLIDRVKYF
jgi:hypothetical protein